MGISVTAAHGAVFFLRVTLMRYMVHRKILSENQLFVRLQCGNRLGHSMALLAGEIHGRNQRLSLGFLPRITCRIFPEEIYTMWTQYSVGLQVCSL